MTALRRAAGAEWARIWSVRSSWALLLVTAVVAIGLGTIIGSDAADDPGGVTPGSTAWDGGRFTGMFALFGMVALAAVTASADHATGGIVPTLQWTPRRGLLLAARAGTITLTTTLLGLGLVSAASATIWTFVPDLGLPLGDGLANLGDLAWVLGGGTLLGVGLALVLRSTAGALVSAIALLLVLPLLVAQLPYEWTTTIAAHLPGSGALFLIFGEGPDDTMTTAAARVTLVAWAAGALLLGGGRLVRSDATG
jgi:hypothetical protein